MKRTPLITQRATDNESVAAAADRVAALLEAEGSNHVRVRLWRRAASAVRSSPRSLVELVGEQGVEGIHGLGIDYLVGGMITDLVRTGKLPLLDTLEGRAACGHVFRRVPGIGPRLASELHQVLGVESLEGLAQAAQDGALSQICGFGPRRTRLLASLVSPPKRASEERVGAAQLDLWSEQ